jgi:hypothetical protein
MPTDLTISLLDRPGSLATACDALGRAGLNVEGACGFVCEGRGVFHVLVTDSIRAQRALIDAGFELQAERQVALTRIDDTPGAAAALLRTIADAGVNVDLLYATVDGRLVLGGDDVSAIQAALG